MPHLHFQIFLISLYRRFNLCRRHNAAEPAPGHKRFHFSGSQIALTNKLAQFPDKVADRLFIGNFLFHRRFQRNDRLGKSPVGRRTPLPLAIIKELLQLFRISGVKLLQLFISQTESLSSFFLNRPQTRSQHLVVCPFNLILFKIINRLGELLCVTELLNLFTYLILNKLILQRIDDRIQNSDTKRQHCRTLLRRN